MVISKTPVSALVIHNNLSITSKDGDLQQSRNPDQTKTQRPESPISEETTQTRQIIKQPPIKQRPKSETLI